MHLLASGPGEAHLWQMLWTRSYASTDIMPQTTQEPTAGLLFSKRRARSAAGEV